MRRHNNLYQRIISVDNLKSADMNARIGKSRQPCIRKHDKNREQNIINLHYKLTNHQYRTSPYTTFIITDPKERVIYRLPYYPDRIVHHAVMNLMRPIFMSAFTADTYSCIKGRGIHKAVVNMKKALMDREGTTCYGRK
jgi:RNA-directed DNA polymerase